MKKDYLEELENDETMLEIYNKFYMNVVTAIIHNIKGLEKVTDKEYRQYVKKTTKDIYNKTSEEVLKVNNSVKKDLSKIMKKSANTKMKSMEDLYEYRNVPLIMTKTQLDIVNSAVAKTYKEIKNKNAELPNNAKKQYIKAVNKYSEELVKGNITFQDAVKKATKDVRQKGITMSYKRKDGIKVNVEPDVASRRNIIGNMKDVGMQLNEDIVDQLGADGAETSVTDNARPTHQVWQGRQFVLGSVGKVIDGHYYEPFDRYKDELYDYNCGHDWIPVILGVSSPLYTNKQLQRINNKTVKYKGKKISSYDGTQVQRRLENQIRHTKRDIEALKKSGLDYSDENAKLQQQYKRYREASREMGLEQKYNRLRTF